MCLEQRETDVCNMSSAVLLVAVAALQTSVEAGGGRFTPNPPGSDGAVRPPSFSASFNVAVSLREAASLSFTRRQAAGTGSTGNDEADLLIHVCVDECVHRASRSRSDDKKMKVGNGAEVCSVLKTTVS